LVRVFTCILRARWKVYEGAAAVDSDLQHF
jgi:hypothetical protein